MLNRKIERKGLKRNKRKKRKDLKTEWKERKNRKDKRKIMKYGCSLLALSFLFHLRTGVSKFFQDPLLANFDPRKKYNLDHVTFYTFREIF